MEVDWKDLFLKYIEHIKFYEGIDYLTEGYTHGSPSLNDYELEIIQDELLRDNTNTWRQA